MRERKAPPPPRARWGTDLALPPASQDYYFYLASNWRSAGNVHIDMMSYKKIYDLKAGYQLPERIFLDKGTSYRFSIFLTVRGRSFKSESEHGLWARPSGAGAAENGVGEEAGGCWDLGTTHGAGLLWGADRRP